MMLPDPELERPEADTPEFVIDIDNIVTHNLGIEVVGGKFSCLIPKDTQIPEDGPATAAKEYTTPFDNLTELAIIVFQSAEEVEYVTSDSAECIGEFFLEGIPPKPRGEERINVEFQIDSQNLLKVKASSSSSSGELEIRESNIIDKQQRITPEDDSRSRSRQNGILGHNGICFTINGTLNTMNTTKENTSEDNQSLPVDENAVEVTKAFQAFVMEPLQKVSARLEGLEAELKNRDDRINKCEERIQALEAKLDKISSHLKQVASQLDPAKADEEIVLKELVIRYPGFNRPGNG